MRYDELEALPAERYLDSSFFKTKFDDMFNDNGNNAKDQYETGFATGMEFGLIEISDRSVWSARDIDGGSLKGSLISNEGIGYHRNTKDLLQGFIDSGAKIVIKRFDGDKFNETTIQENIHKVKVDYQTSIIDAMRMEFPNSKIIKLRKLSECPLSGQVKKITDDENSYYELKYLDADVYKAGDKIFVPSNHDIREKIIISKIIKEVDGVEDNASLIRREQLSDVGNLTREGAIPIEFEDNTIVVYKHSKGNHQDQQMVSYVEAPWMSYVPEDKPVNKSNNKIKGKKQ